MQALLHSRTRSAVQTSLCLSLSEGLDNAFEAGRSAGYSIARQGHGGRYPMEHRSAAGRVLAALHASTLHRVWTMRGIDLGLRSPLSIAARG